MPPAHYKGNRAGPEQLHLHDNNSIYMTELGYQLTLSGDFGAAITSYSKACQLDEANMTACYGKITAQVLLLTKPLVSIEL